MSGDGVLVDLHQDDAEERLSTSDKREWITPLLPDLMFGSDQVLAASTDQAPWIDAAGIYFLVFHGRIVYVGQASHLGSRVRQHLDEGRPIASMASIIGLPPWALTEVEHAYIRAWDTPWNAERRRSGSLSEMPELLAASEALDRTMVSPHYPARVQHCRYKAWELHVIGCAQAHAPTASNPHPVIPP